MPVLDLRGAAEGAGRPEVQGQVTIELRQGRDHLDSSGHGDAFPEQLNVMCANTQINGAMHPWSLSLSLSLSLNTVQQGPTVQLGRSHN